MLLSILNQIEWAKGKEKEAVIASIPPTFEENLKQIVEATYKQGLKYFITDVHSIKIKDETPSLFDRVQTTPSYTLEDGLDFLRNQNIKGSASADNKHEANQLYSYMNDDEAEIFQRIIRGDLKVGCSIKTFRKVWGKSFCPDFPKSLCSTFDEKKIQKHIDFWIGAFSELKSDGARAEFVPESTYSPYASGIYTRNGSKIEGLNHIEKDCKLMMCDVDDEDKSVIDGELVVLGDDGEIMPREKGNGIITKCIKGTAKNHEKLRVRFIVWDSITILEFIGKKEPTELYVERFDWLSDAVERLNTESENEYNNISLIETKIVYSLAEAKAHYHEMIEKGEEGTILKDRYGVWGDKRLLNQFKFKEEHEIDAVIVGWYHGKIGSKYEHMIGGFHCESRCGTIKFDVGSGLTDKIRGMDGDYWVGKILECKYNYRTIVNSTEQCLFLPRVIETRFDKEGRENANDLKELIQQEEASRILSGKKEKI